jgi:glycosyltransferase involved in cell wall biosynthesis
VHDLIEALGGHHYQGHWFVDDYLLYKYHIYRIYDVFVPEEDFVKADEALIKMFDEIATKNGGKTLSTNELMWEVGKRLKDPNSIVRSAYEAKVPIFLPAMRDSEFAYIHRVHQKRNKKENVLMVDAFKEVPEVTLYITSAGPEEERLKNLAEGCNNIKFLGPVSENKLLDLYAGCKAVISANIDEDLGLSAIECQAAGKPAITVREGGFAETVIENKTGLFFEPDAQSLINAIKKFNKIKWNKNLIRKNSKKYDIDVFVKRIRHIIKETA